jgi:hypothetical protein
VTSRVRQGISVGGLVGVAMLLVSLTPAVASAAWSPPTTLTAPGDNTEFPTVAANANGDAVAAWYQGGDDPHRLVARISHDSGSTWGARQDLGSAILGEGPVRPALLHAAVGAGGKATLVWQQHRGKHQRIVEAQARNGRFGQAQAISPGRLDASYPDLAVAGSGRVVVVWVAQDKVQKALISKDGTWKQRRAIAKSSLPDLPTVAANRHGRVFFAWTSTTKTDPPKTSLHALRGGRRGGTGEPQQLSDDGAEAPQVAISRRGRSTVVWEQSGKQTEAVIDAASAVRSGKFGRPQELSPSGPLTILGGSGGASSRGVGIDRAGHVSAIWAEDPPAGQQGTSRLRVATSDPAGKFAQPTTLRTTSGAFQFERPAIAVSPRGATTAIWERYSISSANIWGAARAQGTSIFAPATVLSGSRAAAGSLASTSRNGHALAVWNLGTTPASVQAARYSVSAAP